MIKAVRGVPLTFNIRGTDQHPLYITDSIIGGHAITTERIFAGGADSWGTEDKPFVLKWTPGQDTPDVVYYQCFTHQKLGWRIELTSSAHLAVMSLMMLIIIAITV